MQVLLQGIWNKFNGNASLKAVVTGMYFSEAPQGTVYPYIVYHKISGVPDYTYTEDMEGTIIQFNIFDDSNSSTTINDIYTKLINLYDWCNLTIIGWNSIYVKRELDSLIKQDNIWNYMASYRLEIQK